MFIDTHAHLYQDKFSEDIDVILADAKARGVQRIYLPNVDSMSIDQMHNLEATYPNICYAMMGLHPCSVKENYKEELNIVTENLNARKYVGVGEIGIDLYWDKTFIKEQQYAYEYQIDLAKEHCIPFVIHSRESLDLTIKTVEQKQDGSLRGIFHCFNGTIEQMKRIQNVGFLIGLGGVITFKNAKLDDMIREAPNSMIVLETDAPYLAPTPHRGKRNESAYIPIIAQKIAEVKNIDFAEVEEFTTENALELFGE